MVEQCAAYALAALGLMYNHIANKSPFPGLNVVQVGKCDYFAIYAANGQVPALLGEPVDLTGVEWPATGWKHPKQFVRVGDQPRNGGEINVTRATNQRVCGIGGLFL